MPSLAVSGGWRLFLHRTMKLIIRLFALLGAIFVAGCVVQQSVPFNTGDFQAFKGSGLATITGRAFLATTEGNSVSGAGSVVQLTPATPYTKERFAIARSGSAAEPPDPRLAQYVWTTVGDNQGNFVFRGVPPGEYLLSCSIRTFVSSGYQVSMTPRTEETFATVTVAGGESAKVVLTNGR